MGGCHSRKRYIPIYSHFGSLDFVRDDDGSEWKKGLVHGPFFSMPVYAYEIKYEQKNMHDTTR